MDEAPTEIIEIARPGDAAALGALLSDWVSETPWMPALHAPAAYAPFAGRLIARAEVFVARGAGGQATGFLARDGEEVPAFQVAAFARGRGLGARLIARAKVGRERLWLWSFAANTGARRFYAREGFREVDSTAGDNEEGLPDVKLEWRRRQ